jgi:hypothetical protein
MSPSTRRAWRRFLAPGVALGVWGAMLGCGGGNTGPVQLTVARVSAGALHTCGVATAGAAFCWGANLDGRLGNGTTTTSTTAVAMSGGLLFAAVGTTAASASSRSGLNEFAARGRHNVRGRV